jgi:hypothetical protein
VTQASDARFILGSTESQRRNLERHGETLSLLADQLLALGGDKVVVPADPPQVTEFWLTFVLQQGQSFDAGTACLEKGEPNLCHANVIRLWRLGHGAVCAGFALFGDAYCRPHCWVLDEAGHVVETTEACEAYFGHTFDENGAEVFAQLI